MSFGTDMRDGRNDRRQYPLAPMAAEGNKMTTISIGIDIGWIHQHAKFYDIPFKRFVSKRGETSKCGEQMNRRTIIPISLNGSRISPKWFGHSTQTQAHVQLADDKTSGYISMPNFMTFFQVICQQNCSTKQLLQNGRN